LSDQVLAATLAALHGLLDWCGGTAYFCGRSRAIRGQRWHREGRNV